MSLRVAVSLGLVGSLLLAGCGESPSVAGASPSIAGGGGAGSSDVANGRRADWTARLRKLAGSYEGLARVDNQMRWAPALCARAGALAPSVSMSAADSQTSAHGQKIYALWTRDPLAYGALSGALLRPSPDGPVHLARVAGIEGCNQVLVKEAFEAVELPAGGNDAPLDEAHGPARWRGMAPTVHEGRRFRPGSPKGLFVMMRFEAPTSDTDEGWVYGTVSPDGVVDDVGKLESCMACHRAAPYGRLFGLATAR